VRRFTVRKEPAGRRRYEKRASRRDVKGAQGFLISVSDAPVPFQEWLRGRAARRQCDA
jgi:hypothetical protein